MPHENNQAFNDESCWFFKSQCIDLETSCMSCSLMINFKEHRKTALTIKKPMKFPVLRCSHILPECTVRARKMLDGKIEMECYSRGVHPSVGCHVHEFSFKESPLEAVFNTLKKQSPTTFSATEMYGYLTQVSKIKISRSYVTKILVDLVENYAQVKKSRTGRVRYWYEKRVSK